MGGKAQMWDGDGREAAGASEIRSGLKPHVLWGFYRVQWRGYTLGKKKRSFKAVAGAGCFLEQHKGLSQCFGVQR